MSRKTFGGWGFAPETEYIGIGVLWGLGPPKGVKKCTTVLAVIIREVVKVLCLVIIVNVTQCRRNDK